MPPRAGYSGTPLPKKLGIKPGDTVVTMSAPKDYAAILGALPGGATIAAKAKHPPIIHLFVTTLAGLKRDLPKARKAMDVNGAIWVSWYKKAAKVPTDVTEDEIRNLALETDLVDVKVCAVSDLWSGLKLVVRKHLR
jgi:hypothetical protein